MVSNYYPFGMAQTGRNWDGNGNYRYGYNGKEEDNEIKTNNGDNGKSLDYGARWYDPRKARWDMTDPYEAKYPSLSPYRESIYGSQNDTKIQENSEQQSNP